MPEYNPLDDEGPEWADWMRRFATGNGASDITGEFDALAAADLDDDDEETYSPAPHPNNRAWMHPSEVAAAARAAATPAGDEPGEREVATTQLRTNVSDRSPANAESGAARHAIFALATTALIGALVFGGVRLNAGNERADAGPTEETRTTESSSVDADEPANAKWTEAVRARVEPGLARIEAIADGATTAGAGIALDDDGNILTSAVLIEGASHILVWTCDGRYTASIVGLDDLTDVAVVRIDATIKAPDMATDQQVQAGQYALIAEVDDDTAVRIGRVKKIRDNAEVAPGLEVHGLIETTLAPQATLPGAAIFDDLGVVIGMATGQVANSIEVAAHVLPIDLADRVANEILTHGEAKHAWLGVYGVDGTQGALVESIAINGPADQSGLGAGDLITGVEGMPVTSMDDLVSALRGFAPDVDVAVQFSRGDDTHTLTVRLGAVAD